MQVAAAPGALVTVGFEVPVAVVVAAFVVVAFVLAAFVMVVLLLTAAHSKQCGFQ